MNMSVSLNEQGHTHVLTVITLYYYAYKKFVITFASFLQNTWTI